MPNNRNLALLRLLSLEKKFKNNPNFHVKYQKTVNEYIAKGHASKIVWQKHTSKVVKYILHLGAHVVFNAGATYNSTSLNQNLLKRPDLLNSLVEILIRFRVGLFVVMGDIEQMFHQILVENEHRDALRFSWRNNFNHPIDDYRMNVHLFGKIDSPLIANCTVKRSAKDQSELFDTVSVKIIEENFYMDDFLSSFHDTTEAIKICSNVINILSQGVFRLHKFISNNRSILSSLPQAKMYHQKLQLST